MNKHQFKYKYLNATSLKQNWAILKEALSAHTNVELISTKTLEQYIDKVNEFDVLITNMDDWYYIKSQQNTKDEKVQKEKSNFELHLLPFYKKQRKLIDLKILESPFFEELIKKKPIYKILHKKIKNEQLDFDEKDDDLDSKIASTVTHYNNELATMNVEIDGENIFTLAAMTKVKHTNREIRKELYYKIKKKESEFIDTFNNIYDKQIKLRTAKAKALGFSNYRDYNWWEKKCVDYAPEDVEDFCNSIREVFIPIQKRFTDMRKQKLGLQQAMPWDSAVDIFTNEQHSFFANVQDLKEKAGNVYKSIHPDFYTYYKLLDEQNHLDFEARKHKSPAMFAAHLSGEGIPFVYLVAMNSLFGVTIAFHETTHAFHSMYNTDKKYQWLKSPNSEANELFPLSMELIAMDYFKEFVDSEKYLLVSKLNKLESCLRVFRMAALWDRFQTWVYLNPNHNHKERNSYWLSLMKQFNTGGEILEEHKTSWQLRPLIFRLPFYMIEYGISTLGALSIYKNYSIDKTKTIHQLIDAMKLGNTVSLKEIYTTAGITFDFTKEKVKETGDFLNAEIDALYGKIKELA